MMMGYLSKLSKLICLRRPTHSSCSFGDLWCRLRSWWSQREEAGWERENEERKTVHSGGQQWGGTHFHGGETKNGSVYSYCRCLCRSAIFTIIRRLRGLFRCEEHLLFPHPRSAWGTLLAGREGSRDFRTVAAGCAPLSPGWSRVVCRQRWPWEISRKKHPLGMWRWSAKTSSRFAGNLSVFSVSFVLIWILEFGNLKRAIC